MKTNTIEKAVTMYTELTSAGKRVRKTQVYDMFGISYDRKADKIYHRIFGWIKPLLINGNDKLGRGVYTWSMLPTNDYFDFKIDNAEYHIPGTCPCHCKGCYATKGHYTFENVIAANGRKTLLARMDLDFVERAITAQILASNITICRIHAAGDFFSADYINMWRRVVSHCSKTVFWTYTKSVDAENAFNDLNNINVVRSIIPGIGFNFGHCDYIMKVYHALKAIGKNVHICRCGIDKNQHCTSCRGCVDNEIVLFIEHSTEYNAEKDPLFPACKELIESQEKPGTIVAA